MSRAGRQALYSEAQRIARLEEDADGHDEQLAEIRALLTEGFAKCADDSKRNTKLLVGLLLSIVASSFMIVFTVTAIGGGS